MNTLKYSGSGLSIFTILSNLLIKPPSAGGTIRSSFRGTYDEGLGRVSCRQI